MADVITRFKLETTQYDSKLRDTSKALADYTRQATLAGKEFDKFTKENVEAARSFGNIATSATNSKDKITELVSAFNDVAKVYNNLTKEQQQSDFGKALGESMQKLSGRIREAKAELNSTPGLLEQLKEKFVINIDAIKLFNVGLSAAKGALDVAKEAFFNNETQLDDWNRTVESAESVYTGFLDALNTGDISGFIKNIDDIVNAAKDAYNALDALNTFNAFNQINVERTRTGMTEAIADYRGGKGSKDSVTAAGEAYKKELEERKKLERQAYIEAVGKVAAQRGVSKQDLLTALSGSYGSYESLKAIPMSGKETRYTPGGMFGGSIAYDVEVPANRQEKLAAALRRLNDTELQSLQALGAQAERTGNEIAQVDKQLTRVLNGRNGGGGGGGSTTTVKTSVPKEITEMQSNQQRINELTQEYVKISDQSTQEVIDRQAAIREEIRLLEERNAKMKLYQEQAQGRFLGGDVQTTGLTSEGFRGFAAADLSVPGISFEKNNKTDKSNKQEKDIGENMSKLASGLSTLTSGIESLGFEIPDGVKQFIGAIQGIASIIQGVQTVISVFQTSSMTANTAAIIANTAALTANSATRLIPFLANSGIVPHAAGSRFIEGNTFSGDNIFAGGAFVNAGELVLNKAHQNALANQLSGGGLSQLQLEAIVTGEDLRFVINSNGRRTGRGEIVTTNFR